MRRGGFFDGVTHALKAEGHDASEDGAGRGTPLVVERAQRFRCCNCKRLFGIDDYERNPVCPDCRCMTVDDLLQGDFFPEGTKLAFAAPGDPNLPITLAIRGRNGEPSLEIRQDGLANAILTPNGGRAGIGVGAVAFDTTQITSAENRSNPQPGDPCHPLSRGAHPPAIAFSAKDSGADASELAPTLRAGGHTGSHANGGVMPAVAFSNSAGDTALGMSLPGVPPITRRNGDPGNVLQGMTVRRLTPRECERLQGFPDDYTLIPWRGKPAPDGPRYKALGNSWATTCAAWIGRRIAIVDAL